MYYLTKYYYIYPELISITVKVLSYRDYFGSNELVQITPNC